MQPDSPEAVVRVTRAREAAGEWALVLVAEGLHPRIDYTAAGFVVCVPVDEAPAAEDALARFESENAGDAPAAPEARETIGEVERFAAGVVSLAMLAFFAVTGPRSPQVVWFARGSADGARILDGELWRTVTALCLHADLTHVAANALFGAIFLAAVCAGFGPGLGIALTLAAGVVGNLANAFFQGPDHLSIGASTAVFGAVGLLGGRSGVHRIRRGDLGLHPWVPIAAGLALIAMLGTGERSDLSAHLFGFGAGGLLGAAATLGWPRRPGPGAQAAALALALAILLASWHLALR